jgi:ABC-type transport system involved in cytochrome c biogenesis ATPase subunit
MSKRANRLLFSTLVTMVVATTAFLWVAGADPEGMRLIAGLLALAAGAVLLERLDGQPSRRDPNDPRGHLYKWYGNGR